MSGSSTSFSEQEMIRTQGLPYCLIAGKRMTLSTQIRSGLILSRIAGSSFCAHLLVSTTAAQHSLM
ncbi:hypothetical protein D3C81_1756150 [compost metagenome]